MLKLKMLSTFYRTKINACYSSWLALFVLLVVLSVLNTQTVLAAGSSGLNSATNTQAMELQLSLSDKTPTRVVVVAKLQSTKQRSIEFLPWSTPLSSFVDSAIFTVSRDGIAVPYQGLQLKRLAPTADDFVKIAPGVVLENELDISMSYDFCPSGHYRIHFAGQFMQPDATALMLASNTLELVVTDQRFCQ